MIIRNRFDLGRCYWTVVTVCSVCFNGGASVWIAHRVPQAKYRDEHRNLSRYACTWFGEVLYKRTFYAI